MVFDCYVLSVDPAGVAQSLKERGDKRRERAGRGDAEIADHGHRLLLRARNKRPAKSRAAKPDYELAPPHTATTPGAAKISAYRCLPGCLARRRIASPFSIRSRLP